ncbi:hypothetical protein ACHAWF_008674 [Thalassiosira exigua]
MNSDGVVASSVLPTDPWSQDELTASPPHYSPPRHLASVAESRWFHLLARVISSALLFVLVFGMSATVDVSRLRRQVHNKFALLIGVATQFLVMPALGYASVTLFGGEGRGLTEPMAISLLIVTASPGVSDSVLGSADSAAFGRAVADSSFFSPYIPRSRDIQGSYSNWWCSMFNADLALSVTMTALSTMISTVMLPANLLLYVNAAFGVRSGEEGGSVVENIDWPSLFVSLAVVVLAIAAGLGASFKISSRRFNRYANKMGSLSGVLLIMFSAAVSALSGSDEAQLWGQPWSFYAGVTAPCLAGLFVATCLAALARLRKPEVVAVGLECCYQNVGIATSAAVAMFDDPIERGQALCVPLFYGLVEGVVLGFYCIVGWKLGWTKAPRDEKFCVMLVKTYEVDEGETERGDLGGQADEERQEVHPSPTNNGSAASTDAWPDTCPDEERSWKRPWTLFYTKRKRKGSGDTDDAVDVGAVASPRRRVSLAISELSESISQMDAITDMVPFQKPEYSRCRINSEDSAAGTAITAPLSVGQSNASPTSQAESNSIASDTPA